MAENFDLIFGQSAGSQYAWSDSDYQNGWSTVGSTPPTAEQFDALQRRSDTKAKELNDTLTPLVNKAEADGRQASTAYSVGDMVTVDGLPNGWLLECTVAGTSDANAITLPATLIDGLTIVDGTATWTLRKVATEGGLGYRQPSTSYAVGAIAYHASLPTGYYLECTTAGTTSSGALSIGGGISVYDTLTDGTVTWTVCRYVMDFPRYGAFNKKETFTTSGSFTAPVSGTYRITLVGGGGGGGGATNTPAGYRSGGGGGSGATLEFYAKLTEGTSYSYVIGAGGIGGTASAAGSDGGASSITINSTTYTAGGGVGGGSAGTICAGGVGGIGRIGDTAVTRGNSGGFGVTAGGSTYAPPGYGGISQIEVYGGYGSCGTGSNGGSYNNGTYNGGGKGYDGCITFEYCNV